MKTPRHIPSVALALLIPKIRLSAGLPPWQFGMTKEQVANFKEFDPYKTFSNAIWKPTMACIAVTKKTSNFSL